MIGKHHATQKEQRLAALLDRQGLGTGHSRIGARDHSGDLPLSFAQERMWFLDRFEPDRATYNIPVAFEILGRLDVSVLQRCLNELVARHECLRTVFVAVDDKPVQRIRPAAPLTIRIEDLHHVDAARREQACAGLLNAEARIPFELDRGPLVRALLVRRAAEDHVLLVAVHHIAADGWSIGVINRELSTLYEAFAAGEPSPLAELPVQYADFAMWQRETLRGKALESHLTYWKEHLGADPPVLEMPTDRPRPAERSGRGDHVRQVLPRSLADGLNALSRGEGVTLFMTMLAGFATLLQRYSNNNDVVVGSPIANRNRQEIESLVGFFVNTLAMRVDLSGDPTFGESLRRVRATALDGYAHQDLPFEKLVEELQLPRDLSRTPLVQVMFALQNAPTSQLKLPGLAVRYLPMHTGTAKLDLLVTFRDEEEGLVGHWEYDTDLFDASTIERMMTHYRTLLEGAVGAPQTVLSELPLLTEAERQRVVSEWNRTERTYPAHLCLHQLFDAQADAHPQCTAVVFGDGSLTYGALDERANRLAHHLRSLGVGPDVPVGICMECSLDMVVGVLGILKAGGAYVPLDPGYPAERLAFMLRNAGAPVVLTHAAAEDALPCSDTLDPEPVIVRLDRDAAAIAMCPATRPVSEVAPHHLLYVLYTSGSTGRPKGVAMPHAALVNLVHWQLNVSRVDRGERTLQFAPLSFDVSCQEIFVTLSAGGTLCLIDQDTRRDPEALLRVIDEFCVTRLFMPFVALQHLAEAAARVERVPASLREIATAGEQLQITPALIALFERLDRCTLVNQYGPTECHVVSSFALSGSPDQWPALPPIGRPIANTRLYVLDERMSPVPVGVPGELCVGGAAVARGYLHDAGQTAERFTDDPFEDAPGARLYRTGDLARYREDGDIEFLGRIDHQVKLRGFRIEPGEIESVLLEHPSLHQAAVVVREDRPGDRRLAAYVVSGDTRAPDADELRSFVSKQLPDYMVPSAFVGLDTLPLTPSGKVDRRALLAKEHIPVQRRAASVAPRNDVEKALASIWGDVLGVADPGVHDDFFELGGHSLLAVRLFARIEAEFGRSLPLRSLFSAPTIAAFARRLDGERSTGPTDGVILLRKGWRRPPLFCIPPAGDQVFFFRDLAGAIDAEVPVYGLESPGLDGLAAPLDRMDDLAAALVERVLAVQGDGPHLLCGYCNGGLLTIEIGRRLEAMGHRIELLALLDTALPQLLRDPAASPSDDPRKRAAPGIDWRAAASAARRMAPRHADSTADQGMPQGSLVVSTIERARRAGLAAASAYRPEPYDGSATLIRTLPDSSIHEVELEPGWERWVRGGLDVTTVACDRTMLLKPPFVQEVARVLAGPIAVAVRGCEQDDGT